MLRKLLLGSGIVSSVQYVATDILGTLRYPGYRYRDQWFSELTAEGAPTRPLMVALNGIPYPALVAALAAGVWTSPVLASAGRMRAARLTGALLAGYAAFGMAGGVAFPMKPREALAAGEGTRRNTMHVPATAAMSLSLVLAMGCGATLLGKRFRYYTYATIVTVLGLGALTSLRAGRITANEPTPWAGLEERVSIYATMLWLAALALALLRAEATIAPRQLGKPTPTPQTMQRVPR
jgi:Protein of unknown function (DUF998)